MPIRTAAYAKPEREQNFLEDLNHSVAGLDSLLSVLTSKCIKYPFVFVIGAPRSGTTVLAQAIAYCYKAGYITNITARFWKTPLVGIQLSHSILGYDPSYALGVNFFRSHRGRTMGGGGLHEFGYFWKNDLPVDGSALIGTVDLVCKRLIMMQNALGRPLVMKGAIAAIYKEQITRILGKHNVAWVYIERSDTIQNCISILDARRDYFDNQCAWFGYEYPGLRKELEFLSPYKQIVGQVLKLRRYYGSMATHTVLLSSLMKDSRNALNGIFPDFVREPPSGAFESVRHKSRPILEQAFQCVIEEYYQ